MSLIRKMLTPEMLAAAQSNAQKSLGPRTRRGKNNSSRNTGKHLAYGSLSAGYMEGFGEDPAAFENHRQALVDSFQPRDFFEKSLIEEIAALQWRLWRVHRAEEGAIACRMRKSEIERMRNTLQKGGIDDHVQKAHVSPAGYTGLSDSPEKFALVLKSLEDFRLAVEVTGFADEHLVFLRILYGEQLGLRGVLLHTEFKSCQARPESGDQDVSQRRRAPFLARLSAEIANYEKLRDLYLEEEVQVSQPLRDSQLALPSEEAENFRRAESHIEFQIERKLRQLYARRREHPVTAGLPAPQNLAAREGGGDSEPGPLAPAAPEVEIEGRDLQQ